ncbi:MAG: tRNA 2-thiouridine(34) synthase MnmA [Kiritimatiellia bacterium]|nr:tRNA 2-thiouridine(34) synthase MnmA [Kiritimatiellia bacterium]
MKPIVAVAMSGGMDSSAAAALLIDRGHKVFGLTAKMWSSGSRCCSDEDIRQAQRVAAVLEIPHYVIDLHEPFSEQIVGYFADEYVAGRTPSPCGLCNPLIKFGLLMDKARTLGAELLATGHYVRLHKDDSGICHLFSGQDKNKDQSYFLFDLSQEQLSSSIFPVGGMTKREVRDYTEKRGIPLANRGESQELCFVTDGEHYELTEKLRPDVRKRGDILDTGGHKVGEHEGIHRFTVGQRRGLGIALGEPMYVVRLDADTNTVVVGKRSELDMPSATVGRVNWISDRKPASPFPATTLIRYNHAGAASTVTPNEDGSASVVFDEPQFAVAPGQIAAFYRDDELLGGGWIQ